MRKKLKYEIKIRGRNWIKRKQFDLLTTYDFIKKTLKID